MHHYPTITGRKIKIAVVGCGRISRNHFGSIEKHSSELELVAVCDIDPAVLAQHAETYKVPAYRDMEEMLQKEQIDLVALCTPSGIHPEQAVLAAGHKVHVMTEKPMATRWNDGVRMVKACDDAGVRLFVVKQNRFNAPIVAAKHALHTGALGKLYLLTANVFWTRPQSYYDQDSWRGTWALDGGAFMNQASHYVDMMFYLA